jgi:tripartite-type tricarboxylate transporter receptor subunit TctC
MKRLSKVFFIPIFLGTALLTSNAVPQEPYPNRPITLVVPWAAGQLDTMSRVVSKIAEKELGQPIIVENRPGASSAIGVNHVLKSKPDGYTLGISSTAGFIINPHVQKVPFNPLTDITDIIAIYKTNQLLAVRADGPWNTFEDLIEYAKNNPGKFTYAVSGIAPTQQICMERIAKKEGIKWTAVPFKGGGAAVLAALGGHTDGVTQSTTEISPHVKAGKLKLLLILAENRLPGFPNIPSILEKGYNFTGSAYMGIFGPRGMPEPIRQRLEDVFKKAVQDPSFIEVGEKFQIGLGCMGGKEFANYWRLQYDEMGKVIKELGLGVK